MPVITSQVGVLDNFSTGNYSFMCINLDGTIASGVRCATRCERQLTHEATKGRLLVLGGPYLGLGDSTNKPPAFLFYAKDWLTSETVLRMSEEDEGLYIRLLAHSWNSADPGTLPGTPELIGRLLGKNSRRIRAFFRRNPETFRPVDGRFVNDKLYSNWLQYKELSDKRRAAAMSKHDANAKQLSCIAPTLASASAIKDYPSEPEPNQPTRVLEPETGNGEMAAASVFGDCRRLFRRRVGHSMKRPNGSYAERWIEAVAKHGGDKVLRAFEIWIDTPGEREFAKGSTFPLSIFMKKLEDWIDDANIQIEQPQDDKRNEGPRGLGARYAHLVRPN